MYHSTTVQQCKSGRGHWGCIVHHKYAFKKKVFDKATLNRVNICTNQNETLMKQIQNSQKSIVKSIPAYGF